MGCVMATKKCQNTDTCKRHVGVRGECWWTCDHCRQAWNERNTGPAWRPCNCPERKNRENSMGTEAYRHQKNHDG